MSMELGIESSRLSLVTAGLAQRAATLSLSEGVISLGPQDASLLGQAHSTSDPREAGSGFSSYPVSVPGGVGGLVEGTRLAFRYVDSPR